MKNVIMPIVLVISFSTASFAGINTPIAHWTFDETSGATAHDRTGSYNGTVNSATWTTGKVNGALDFDGVNDYVNFGDIDEMEFGNSSFSISCWFYTKGTHDTGPGNDGKNAGMLAAKYDLNAGRQWLLGQRADGTVGFAAFYSDHSLGSKSLDSTTTYSAGQWVHCVGVVDGSQMYLYMNGVLDNSGSCLGTITGYSTNVLVGAIQSSSTNFYQRFNGIIDDVRVYDYALNASEVYQLYTIPEPATLCLFALAGLIIRKK